MSVTPKPSFKTATVTKIDRAATRHSGSAARALGAELCWSKLLRVLLAGGIAFYALVLLSAMLGRFEQILVPVGGGEAIKANSALCAFLLGTAVVLLAFRRWDKLAIVLIALSASIGSAALIENFLNADFGIDELFVQHWWTAGSQHPTRMAPHTSVLTLLSAIAAFMGMRGRNNTEQATALIIVVLSLISVAGYTFGLQQLYQVPEFNRIPFEMALIYLGLGVSLFLTNANAGFGSVVTRTGFGGTIARTLLPFSLLFPFIGLVSGFNQHTSLELALLVVAFALILPGLVLWLSWGLSQQERRAEEAIAQMQATNQELLRRTDEAERAREDAERLARDKAELVSVVSHEVRTPLAGVMGLAEILTMKEEGLDEEAMDMSKTIFEASQHLLQVLNEMLDYSKLAAGKVALESVPFSLRKTVAQVMASMAPRAKQKGLSFEVNIDEAIPEIVMGDQLRLSQILLNLIHNAVKFTESGTVTVSCQLVRSDDSSVLIKFLVADTGIGIGAEQKANLFQQFSQAEQSTTRKYGGSGLGLSISKSLVEMMGGQIQIDSKAGEGATFSFRIGFGRESGRD